MFLNEGASSNDVLQGALGDCWFIAALSALSMDDEFIYQIPTEEELKKVTDSTVKKMIQGIHPFLFHALEKFGIYVFKFFKGNQWVYVVIDDRIPCYVGTID